MCGIAGFFSKGRAGIDAVPLVLGMSKKIAHRGPDGEGIMGINGSDVQALFTPDTPTDHRFRNWKYSPQTDIYSSPDSFFAAAMAHRRLSVLDLSAKGHQPMSDLNGRYWIVFNGEIYNYKLLRSGLVKQGYVFNSETDTEVVLASYIMNGSEMLKQLDGMFAFAIYDASEKRLFCARDQTGVKPFLYVNSPDYFSFGSEEKIFFALSTFNTSVRPEAVFDFFVLGKFGHEREGFFSGVMELDAGSFLVYDLNQEQLTITNFRDVSQPALGESKNVEEKFRSLFFDAVRVRLQADVRVGACLSGGLDSSSIAAGMFDMLGSGIPFFTASFDGQSFDETVYAETVSKKFNGEHHLIKPDQNGLDKELDDLIYSQDIPLWSTSTFAQHAVMRGVRAAQIKVVLDGQGGDELLGGYHHHYYSHWRKLLSSGKFKLLLWELNGAARYLPLGSYLVRAFLRSELIDKLPVSIQTLFLKSYFREMRWLNPEFIKDFQHRLNMNEHFSDLQALLDSEIYGWRLKGYLKCEDRAAMWHSVESRTPFADSLQLIQFCRTLDYSWKIRNGSSKYLLRKSMQGFVPSEILNRTDKIGYATPNKAWIKAILPRALDEIRQGGSEFFDMKKIELDFKNSLSSENPHDTRIFKFISFGVWRRIFKV